MVFNVEIKLHQDGYCEAFCPEMGLSTSGTSLEEALNKIRNLMVYYSTTMQDAGIDSADRRQAIKQLQAIFKNKNFVLPQRPKIH